MPVGDQHHGGIAVAVAILPASIDQAGNLGIGEVLAGADLRGRSRRGRSRPRCPWYQSSMLVEWQMLGA